MISLAEAQDRVNHRMKPLEGWRRRDEVMLLCAGTDVPGPEVMNWMVSEGDDIARHALAILIEPVALDGPLIEAARIAALNALGCSSVLRAFWLGFEFGRGHES